VRGGGGHESWAAYQSSSGNLYADETRVRHSLFGAHLDDIVIQLQDKKTKVFASRGQQKLIIVLLKIAQLRRLVAQGINPVFLLDDFMTDFDEGIMEALMNFLINLESQLIFTAPARGALEDLLVKHGALKVRLDRSVEFCDT
jgi:DNA replication and repair protein RecF